MPLPKRPAGHALHALCHGSSLYMPTTQVLQADAIESANVPLGHVLDVNGHVAWPSTLSVSPSQGVQVVCPASDANVPAGQVSQDLAEDFSSE